MREPGEEFGRETLPKEVMATISARIEPSKAESLTDLSREFAFFTTAPFHVYAGLLAEPLQEFAAAHSKATVALLPFEKPIFSGFKKNGDVYWNHMLGAVDREHWQRCLQFLSGVVMKDTPKKIFWRSLPHSIEIVDALLLQKSSSLPDPLPMVGVTVFGLDGNLKKVVVQRAINPSTDIPKVLVRAPDRATVLYARNLFRRPNR